MPEVERVPVLCLGCGNHLMDRAGDHFFVKGSEKQRLLVRQVDWVRCLRRVEVAPGKIERCSTVWRPSDA